MRAVAVLCFILGLMEGATQAPHDADSYCEAMTFEPQCGPEEVVVMAAARYGRMHLGKCVKTDYGSVGCYESVRKQMDARCSGQRTCAIRIPDTELDETKPCPPEFKTYLEANYTCVAAPGASCQQCTSLSVAHLSQPRGYIASVISSEQEDTTGCGTTRCPWVIEVLPGQKVNLTLFDFTSTPSASMYSPTTCLRYAVVREKDAHDEHACAGKGRISHLHTSITNRVEIHIVTPQVFSDRGQFMIYYEAVGCAKYDPPAHTWLKEEAEGKVSVNCMATKESWVVTCEGTKWIGEVGVCPSDFTHPSTQHTITLPLGVLVAIIVGIALVIGVLILTIGLVCLKRWASGWLRNPIDAIRQFSFSFCCRRRQTPTQYRRPESTYTYYGRTRTSSSGFHEDMSDATPLQYAKKERSPEIQKRRLPVPGSIRENVYMESRPLPSIPDLHEVDEDKSDRSSKVQVYRTSSGREHYHNPRLVVNMRNEPPHSSHPPSIGSDPPYFVLDPDELDSPSGHSSANGSASGRFLGRGALRSDLQKSPEEENAENSCKEVSFNSSCHELPPLPSTEQLGSESSRGNCSWP